MMIRNKLYKIGGGLAGRYLILLMMVMGTPPAAAQASRILESIAQKFESYCNMFPWEEVYLHTDRTDYIAGEGIWFETYVFDRQSSKLSADSRIVYVEVLNFVNRPVVQMRIALKDGTGPGQISLPDTLSSGNYTLRAYTNWMKNFLPSNCFTKKLNIYNPVSSRRFVRFDEPPAETAGNSFQGFNLKVNQRNSQRLELNIITDRSYRMLEGSNCLLLVQTHGLINYRTAINLASDSTTAYISRSLLPPGINDIVFFTAGGRLVREMFVFTPSKHSGMLTAQVNDRSGTREKISVDLAVNENLPKGAIPGSMSVSIAPAGSEVFPDISDYMLFGSEFSPVPDELMTGSLSEMPEGKLNEWLAGLHSNWISWTSIISESFPPVRYKKENAYHYIYGRLTNKLSQQPDPGRYLFLSIPGKSATFQYAKSDARGEFDLAVPVESRIKDLIIQPEDVQRNNTIEVESSFSGEYNSLVMVSDSLSGRLPEVASAMCVNYQVRKIYGSDEVPSDPDVTVVPDKLKRFYGKPDIELKMDDYIKLPVMQEVFFELMPGVFLKKRKSEYEITIADPVDNRIYTRPPVLFVDGVPVNDASVIANLDPERVEKIEAVKERYLVGDFVFFGLVNVITRAGDYSNVSLPEYAVRMPYRVTGQVKSFASPDYSSPAIAGNRIPDLLNTLYWNPA
ncbi:MAG: hypothetical protein WCE64_11730, partial [Bacteroidales bacterium]